MGRSAPKTLQASIERSGDLLSIAWQVDEPDGKMWKEYTVPMDTVQRRSEDVLEALRGLEATDWEDESGADLQPKLHNLARAGAAQYEDVMKGTGSSVDDAAKFKAWFEKEVVPNSADWRIQIVHHQYDAPLICWGLTFSKPVGFDASKLTLDWEDYQEFWSISFKLSCRGILLHEADRMTDPLGDFETRVPLTIEVDDLKEHTKDMSDGATYDAEAQVAHTVQRFERFSQSYQQHNVFWYLSLEQEDNAFVVDDDEITISSVRRARDNIGKVFIMFLDGGSVIRGKRGWRWVDTLLDKGRTGLISTEVDVTNDQLKFLGWDFLRHVIMSGQPLIDGIYDARKEFWPKSLLYGVYLDPLHIYFKPPPENEVNSADKFLKSVKKIVRQSG